MKLHFKLKLGWNLAKIKSYAIWTVIWGAVNLFAFNNSIKITMAITAVMWAAWAIVDLISNSFFYTKGPENVRQDKDLRS